MLLMMNLLGLVVYAAFLVRAASQQGGITALTGFPALPHTPITTPWWSFVGAQAVIFVLQAGGIAYQFMDAGYTVDGRKTAVVKAIGRTWQMCWLCVCAAYLASILPGGFPAFTSIAALAGALGTFACSYACLMELNPLLERVHKSEESARAAAAGGAALVRNGMTWRTAYVLFRVPTSISAALSSMQAAAAIASLIVPFMTGPSSGIRNASAVRYNTESACMAVLVAVLVAAVFALHQLEDFAYAVTVVWSLVSLIISPHTHMVVKGLSIALTSAITLRAAVKATPDD